MHWDRSRFSFTLQGGRSMNHVRRISGWRMGTARRLVVTACGGSTPAAPPPAAAAGASPAPTAAEAAPAAAQAAPTAAAEPSSVRGTAGNVGDRLEAYDMAL